MKIRNRDLTPKERAITRTALKSYADALEKKAKELSKLECSTDELDDLVRDIRGDGHAGGLVGVFTEQMSLGDQTQMTIDDEKRALDTATSAVANALVDMRSFPDGPAPYIDRLKRFVRTWSDGQRSEALRYAIAANELREGEVMSAPPPERVRQAIARAHEWVMTDDDREHWIGRGPFEVAFENDLSTNSVLWYARRTEVTGEGDERTEVAVVDPDQFPTEREAQACAARLNQHWFLSLNGEDGDGSVPVVADDETPAFAPSEEAVIDRARSLAAAEGDFAIQPKEDFITRARQELIDEAKPEQGEGEPAPSVLAAGESITVDPPVTEIGTLDASELAVVEGGPRKKKRLTHLKKSDPRKEKRK